MEHRREHLSLLAGAERRLLVKIAQRLPRRINSDHLTLLGLISMPLAGLAFAFIPATPWAAAAFVTGRWPGFATSNGRGTATTWTT
jgi:hypothetical protein